MSTMKVKTVQYLCAVSNYLDYKTPAAKNITRHLRERCALGKDEYGHNLRLPKQIFGPQKLCPKCLTPWSKGLFKLTLQSLKKSKGQRKKSLKKLMSKDQSELNKFQTLLLNRIQSNSNNFMIITCLECSTVTKIKLPQVISPPYDINNTYTTMSTPSLLVREQSKKKRKKKKRDLTCGLNMSALVKNKNDKYEISSISKNDESVGLETNSGVIKRKNSFSIDSKNCKKLKLNISDLENGPNSNKHKCSSSNESKLESHQTDVTKYTISKPNPSHQSYISKNELGKNIDPPQTIQVDSRETKIVPNSFNIKKEKSPANTNVEKVVNSHANCNEDDLLNNKSTELTKKFNIARKGLENNNKKQITKINLLSQPSLNKLQNKYDGNKINHSNSKETMSKNKINKQNSNTNSNKNKKQGKGRSKKSKNNSNKVFENANCRNSLCINDLLNLV